MKKARRIAISISQVVMLLWLSGACAESSSTVVRESKTLSSDDIRHLLSRTGLGVTPSQLHRYSRFTRIEAIDTLIAEFSEAPSTPMPDWVTQPLPGYHARADMSANDEAIFNNERDLELAQLKQWWALEMLQTSSPQTERMVLFWHDVFASSYYDTDQQSLAMARQNQTFRRQGLGSWRKLLKAMIRDPALLEFLNAGTNHKDSPNENLARELLELFTLGEGNFDEFTVKEAARALTGHDTDRSHNLAFNLKTWQQDRGEKNLFGNSANHTGDDLIDQILNQPEAARFLSARFWSAFVSDSVPDTAWVDSVSQVFRDSDYQIEVLYRALLKSEAFWSVENRGSMIKSPVDLLVGTSRSLEYPKHQWHQVSGWLGSLDMELFAPPNVSGWSEGAAFITPGRLLSRYKVVDELVSTHATVDQRANKGPMNPMMAGNDQFNARVKVRLAAEDYQGPVQYQVILSNSGQQLWQSAATEFAYGHDTEKLGRIGDRSDAVWVTEAIAAPATEVDAATHITVSFLNDAAGPGGDRNLYVEGVEVDDQWFSSTDAIQQSACEPELAANSGRLYCEGTLQFKIRSDIDVATSKQPAWSASAVHVEWARDDIREDIQSVYITLDHFKTSNRYYPNFQFSLNASQLEPLRLRVESFGCWPSCVTHWPDCAWVDENFVSRKTLAFPLRSKSDALWRSEKALACHLEQLKPDDRQLIDVLWNNASTLLLLADGTPRAEQFDPILKKVLGKLRGADVSVEDSIFANTTQLIDIDERYLPVSRPRATLKADMPVINNQDELMSALTSSSLTLHRLLVPELPKLDVSQLSLSELVRHPVFQLK